MIAYRAPTEMETVGIDKEVCTNKEHMHQLCPEAIIPFANEIQSTHCSMDDKNPETDIGAQPEDQKSKAAIPGLLSLPQTEMGDLASRNPQPETDLRPVSLYLIFLSSAGIKGKHHPPPASMAN